MQQQNTFQVPTIDVAPYLANPASPAANKTIDDVRAACISTGFFQIVGHGIPKHLQQGIFDAAHNYFALPLDEKKKLDSSKTVGHRGYDVLASQSYEEGVEPDLKEVSVLDCSNFFVFPSTPEALSFRSLLILRLAIRPLAFHLLLYSQRKNRCRSISPMRCFKFLTRCMFALLQMREQK